MAAVRPISNSTIMMLSLIEEACREEGRRRAWRHGGKYGEKTTGIDSLAYKHIFLSRKNLSLRLT